MHRFGGDTLAAQGQAGHVVRTVDGEEQREGDQIYTEQNRDRVHNTPHQVCGHGIRAVSGISATALSRRRHAITAGVRAASAARITTSIGTNTGAFH